MQYFVDFSYARGLDCKFTTEDIAGYSEPEEFTRLAADIEGPTARHISNRIESIRSLFSKPTS